MKILIISSMIIAVTFIAYRLFLKNEINFKQLRAYLLISMVLSLVFPFNNFEISAGFISKQDTHVSEPVNKKDSQNEAINYNSNEISIQTTGRQNRENYYNWLSVIKITYLLITSGFLLKVIIQVLLLVYKFFIAEKKQYGNCILLYNHGFKNSFSFFKWVYIDSTDKSEKDIENIVTHEIVHVEQYHSFDLIIIELLAAVMWFNPFVWMMREEIQLVHEYLADEGVLDTGINKFSYQELLINQVAEEKLIHISSSFNQSLIKKRIIMMNKNKLNQKKGLKILVLVPLAVSFFLAISCVNGQNPSSEVVAAVAPTKMNVLYVGIENPIKIAVSGFESSDLEVSITNGDIKGEKGDYIITPGKPGNLIVTVKAKGQIVQNAEFRVKAIPNPAIYVNRQKGGEITKEDLLKQEEIKVVMENFDFDVRFEVVSFTVYTVNGEGFMLDATSESNKITKNQKELIKSVKPRSKVNFENITVKGPDGEIKKVSPIIFEIVE